MPYIRIRFGRDSSRVVSTAMTKTARHLLWSEGAPGVCVWQPHMDMYEAATEIILLVEVAGVRREDLHLEVSSDTLTISGRRAEPPLESSARFRMAEIPFGPFERRLTLPAPVDADTVRATYANGLLIIRMSKRPLDRVHRVLVQSGP